MAKLPLTEPLVFLLGPSMLAIGNEYRLYFVFQTGSVLVESGRRGRGKMYPSGGDLSIMS